MADRKQRWFGSLILLTLLTVVASIAHVEASSGRPAESPEDRRVPAQRALTGIGVDAEVSARGRNDARIGDTASPARMPHRSTIEGIKDPLAFQLGRSSIARGGMELAAPSPRSERLPSGALVVDRGVAREKLEVQLDGIEQSWRFDAPPPGDGALIVRQPVENATSLGRAAHGERLRVGAQREGLVYGDATWVDARGMQTAIPARWRNGAIELDVPEATISSSSYPAVLDPTVGAMFPIGPPEAFPEGCASSPSIVSAVGQSLVTWTCSVGPYIQGIRISSDGTLVDSAPWSVGYAGSTLTPMASNGSDYCILERQQGQSALLAYAVSGQTGAVTGTFPAGDSVGGNGPVAFAYGGGVYLAAYGLDNGVSALLIDGSCTMPLMPPDVGPIVITQSPPAPQSLSVAFDGTNFLVVQSGACENQPGLQCPSVVGTRVSTTGAVVDPTPVTLVSGAGDVSVAYGGGEYLLTWTSSGGIVAAHVSPSTLAVLDAPPLSVGTSSGPADVAYGSGEFFVSWVDSTSDDVVGARVTSSVLDAPPIVIDTGVSLAGLLEHRSIRFV